MVWYSHLIKNFPSFTVVHTAKGFSIVSEAEVFFLEFPCFFYNPMKVKVKVAQLCLTLCEPMN